jgi:hypothetical protein
MSKEAGALEGRNTMILSSAVDPHWFQCGSGSSFLYQCRSNPGSKTNAVEDPDPDQT